MMKANPFIIGLCIILFYGCSGNQCNDSDIRQVVSDIMSQQESAWNNADAEGFMQGYWKSDSLVFVGRNGLTFGWDATLANYRESYPDRASMGRLKFENKVIDRLSCDVAFVSGKWELFREADTLSGYYSLVWRNLGGKWVIVADHSS